MQRWIAVLAVVLGLQLLLAVALVLHTGPVATATPDQPLLPASVKDADDILIEGGAAGGSAASTRVELVRRHGAWVLPAYFDAPANSLKTAELIDRLTDARRGLPIATSNDALRRFKVTDRSYERRLTFRHKGRTLATLYLGSSAGLRRIDVRTDADRAVYVVDLATYDLPAQNAAWLDRSLLQRDPTSLVELDATVPHDSIRLTRPPQNALPTLPGTASPATSGASATSPAGSTATTTTASAGGLAAVKTHTSTAAPSGTANSSPPGGWSAPGLPAGQSIDQAHADDLARAVASLSVDAVLGTQPQASWHQTQPVLTLNFQDDRHRSTTWTLSKPDGGDFYVLKSSAHPWYFSIASTTGKALADDSTRASLLTAPATGKRPASRRK